MKAQDNTHRAQIDQAWTEHEAQGESERTAEIRDDFRRQQAVLKSLRGESVKLNTPFEKLTLCKPS